jgi:hypothetical protein
MTTAYPPVTSITTANVIAVLLSIASHRCIGCV